jgi:hypothetical protein
VSFRGMGFFPFDGFVCNLYTGVVLVMSRACVREIRQLSGGAAGEDWTPVVMLG